jgi:peptidoglycan/xylan/chitin deacetylase (PgdA/CDA1 family)
MRRSWKLAALRQLRAAGVFSAATRLRRRNTLLILCYHGISLADEHEWEGGLYITPALFRRRLQVLRNLNANVLPLAEGLERLQAGTLPPRSVVLTFDDGFYDFYRHAVPLLTEFGFPSTIYLTTYYCDYKLPIVNLMVSYLLWKSDQTGMSTGEGRVREVARLMQQAEREQLDTLGKNRMAESLAASFGIDYQPLVDSRMFQIMNPEEVALTARQGIDVQLHTHRHRTPADRELFLREIRDNSRRIHELTGQTPHHFCYPSGVTSPQFLPWLRECGVKSATTCNHGLAKAGSDPLMLPRFLDATGVDDLDFESWLSGIR